MKITCPGCNTSYSVDPVSFPATGRTVRCARCKDVWHAVPYLPDADILPPESDKPKAPPAASPKTQAARPPVAPEADADGLAAETPRARIVDDGTGDGPGVGTGDGSGHAVGDNGDGRDAAGGLGIEQAASSRARTAAQKAGKGPKIRIKNTGRRSMEAFFVGAALAVMIAAIHYREDVVRALPSTAGLYEMVGTPVNLRGLEFANVLQRRDFEDGVPVLIVEGEIANVEGRAIPVPALRFALRGKDGDELYAWTIEPRQRVIEPSAAMNFRTRLASPPRGADDVMIRFIERDRKVVEYTK